MRRVLPMLLVPLGFSLACGGLGTGSGTRVVVVRAGTIDAETDAHLARGVGAILKDRGFLVTLIDEPLDRSSEDLAMDARYAASRAGAANAVLLELWAEEVREGVLPGTALHEVHLDAAVVNLDVELDVVRHRFAFASEDTGPLPVERRTVTHWETASGGFAVRHLFVTPEVGEVMMGVKVPMDEMSAANELRKRSRQVADATERAFTYERWCEEEAERVAGFEAEGLTCVGDPCGGVSVLGVVGNEVIVQDARRVPWFGVPVKKTATWSEPPERILAWDLEGGERVLVTAQNLYGLGDVVPGASVVTADWFSAEGGEAIVGLDVASGERRALSLLEDGERSDLAAVAPDGSAVAYCLRDDGPCYLDSGNGREDMPRVRAAGWVVSDAGPRLVGQVDETLVSVAADGTVVEGGFEARLLEVIGASAEGIDLVVRTDDGCARWSVDAESLEVGAREALPSCPWQATPLPGGGFVAIAKATAGGDDVPGDAEVVRWVPGAGGWDVLTQGSFREELPYVLEDGRIVFNRRLEPAPPVYDTKLYRRLVCTVDGG